MKLTILSCLLVGICSASPPVAPPADFLAPAATPAFSVTDFIKTLPKHTQRPDPEDYPYANIELRQNLGVDLGVGSAPAAGQVGPVTTYSINVQQGATAVLKEIVYTQTFAAVLEQFPKAKSGTIGYGSLQKREAVAEAEPTPEPEVVNTGIAGRIRI